MDGVQAPAWLLPQTSFPVNLMQGELVPTSWPSSWRGYPPVPMLLPKSSLCLRCALVYERPDYPRGERLMLLLRGLDDELVGNCQAWHVATALTGLLALTHSLLMDPAEAAPVPIAASLMPALEMSQGEILASLNLNELDIDDPVFRGLTNWSWTGAEWSRLLLLLPAFIVDSDLWWGAQYYLASANLFTFLGDDLRDTLADRETRPETPYRQVDGETAVWLAYKAVESVIGDPPAARRRLERLLGERGLSDFEGGWRHEPSVDIASKVSHFVKVRDSRTAHGRHHSRRGPAFTYFEIMDYQYFSSAVVLHCAEKVLARLGLPTP